MARKGPRSKASRLSIEAAEKRAQALELRKRGYSYRAIAEDLGFASESGARKTIELGLKALRDTVAESAEEMRAIELERLDAMLKAMWPAVTATTHVVGMSEEGPIDAPGPDTRQVQAAIKLMERRAKLMGLDSATKLAGHDGGPLQTINVPEIVRAALARRQGR